MEGQLTCTVCEEGKYQADAGQSSCNNCRTGFICPAGSSVPREAVCDGGTYYAAHHNSIGAGVPNCTACEPGFECRGASSPQKPCMPGSYAPLARMSECERCPAGYYQDLMNATMCKQCRAGQYCPQGAPAPLPCFAGSYSDATDLKEAAECTKTGAGFYAPTGSTDQMPCASGTIAPTGGLGACVQCDAGEFQDAEGAIECEPCSMRCPTGQYHTGCGGSSQGSCTPCTKANSEYFTPDAEAQIADTCPKARCSNLQCDPGSVRTGSCGVDATRSNDEYECKACFAGTYAAHGNQSCSKCTAGKYQANEGQTACEACPPGYHCREGSATPIPCEGGTFGNATGLASPLGCTPVRFGEWAPTGAVLPEKCYTGFRCPGRLNDKENIPPGSKPILISQGGMATEEQVEVVTQELTLDTSLEEYNETEVRHTLAWQLGVPVELIALSVRSGSLLLTVSIATQARSSSSSSSLSSSSSQPPVITRDLMASLLNASAIGSALGMPVRSYTTPRTRIETRVVEAKCPRELT